MFRVCFCNHQYSRGKAATANHVSPTQLVIVSSCSPTRLSRRAISQYSTPLFIYFISDVCDVHTFEIK